MRPVNSRSTFALAALLLPGLALAHGGHHHPAALPWQFDPLVLSLLVPSGAAFAFGAWRLRDAGRWAVLGWPRTLAFIAGMLLLVVALLSPLDSLADRYFSAHMTQHLILMLAAPPLLVVAQPAVVWMWCLPPASRRALTRGWAGDAAPRRVLAVLLHPLVVWVATSLALWFWHLPGPYGWALANTTVHSFEHACFFVTSLAFWYLLFAPRGRARLGYGGAILFGVTLGIQNGFLGAILTFASHPFYASHSLHGGLWSLTALEDQQLAGLIMWVPASVIHLALLGALCAQWIRADERQFGNAGARRPLTSG